MSARQHAVAGLTLCLASVACARAPVWLALSPDRGTRVAVHDQKGRSCVAIDEAVVRCHDAVSLTGVTFAARGGSVAYPARVSGRWVIVHNGRAGPSWDGVGMPVLSSDGAHVAYAATSESRWRVVVDERSGEAFDAIIAGTIVFDAAGAHHAYVALRGDSAHVVIDGEVSRGWTAVSRPILAEGGARSAFSAKLGDSTMLVIDGRPGPAHEAIGQVVFSIGTAEWAYAARDAGVWQVVTGPTRQGPFDEVRDLSWPENRREGGPAFIARTRDREAAVVGGAALRWHTRVSSLVFARSGSRWGYIADATEVYLDGELLATEGEAADLAIADDGTRIAYVAMRGASVEVVDGAGRHAFDAVVPATLQFLAGRTTWACLVSDRTRRTVFVVVDGRPTNRRLDWTEVVRIVQRPDAPEALRALVAAEAQLALGDPLARR